jgi:hypothetical protein
MHRHGRPPHPKDCCKAERHLQTRQAHGVRRHGGAVGERHCAGGSYRAHPAFHRRPYSSLARPASPLESRVSSDSGHTAGASCRSPCASATTYGPSEVAKRLERASLRALSEAGGRAGFSNVASGGCPAGYTVRTGSQSATGTAQKPFHSFDAQASSFDAGRSHCCWRVRVNSETGAGRVRPFLQLIRNEDLVAAFGGPSATVHCVARGPGNSRPSCPSPAHGLPEWRPGPPPPARPRLQPVFRVPSWARGGKGP